MDEVKFNSEGVSKRQISSSPRPDQREAHHPDFRTSISDVFKVDEKFVLGLVDSNLPLERFKAYLDSWKSKVSKVETALKGTRERDPFDVVNGLLLHQISEGAVPTGIKREGEPALDYVFDQLLVSKTLQVDASLLKGTDLPTREVNDITGKPVLNQSFVIPDRHGFDVEVQGERGLEIWRPALVGTTDVKTDVTVQSIFFVRLLNEKR